jgi:hypothetical protein
MSAPAGAGHALPANRRRRILFAALLTVLPFLAAMGERIGRAEGTHPPTLRLPAGVNGPLVALHTPGGMGGSGEILEVRQGRVARVLVRGLPSAHMGGLAPSPRGRYVAFGEDVTVAPGAPPQTQGLWLVPNTGGSPRRLPLPPRSVEGNQLGIGPLAWSPDRYTLAYAVNPGGGVMNVSRPEPALGIWLTRYDHVHPRLLVTFAQLGAVDAPPLQAPFVINHLSWSPDGRTLAVSTFRRLPGAPQPAQPVPVILGVNTATGAVRMLVRGAQDGVFAPRGAALAYTTSRSGPAGGGTLQVADAQGRHGLVLAKGTISSPAWAPDGRTLAYIDGGTAIRTVAVATGQTRLVLTVSTQGLHPPAVNSSAWPGCVRAVERDGMRT